VCAILPVLAAEEGGGEIVAPGEEESGDPLVGRALEQVGRWWPVG
jgi:hypothetical protein